MLSQRMVFIPPILPQSLSTAAFIDFLVDLGNLTYPYLALFVLHIEYVVYRPMEVISDIRYLLIKLIKGVA